MRLPATSWSINSESFIEKACDFIREQMQAVKVEDTGVPELGWNCASKDWTSGDEGAEAAAAKRPARSEQQ